MSIRSSQALRRLAARSQARLARPLASSKPLTITPLAQGPVCAPALGSSSAAAAAFSAASGASSSLSGLPVRGTCASSVVGARKPLPQARFPLPASAASSSSLPAATATAHSPLSSLYGGPVRAFSSTSTSSRLPARGVTFPAPSSSAAYGAALGHATTAARVRTVLSALPTVSVLARAYGDTSSDPYVRLLLDMERRANADPLNISLQETFAHQLCEYSSSAFLRRYEAGYLPRTPAVRDLYAHAQRMQHLSLRARAPLKGASAWSEYTSGQPITVTSAANSGAGAGPSKVSRLFSTFMALCSFSFMCFIVYMLVKGPKGLPGGLGAATHSEATPEMCQTKFGDVLGCNEAVSEARELVAFLRSPDDFTALGAEIPRGMLLTGPPGTGKTLLAKAVAGEAGVPFFFISGSAFDEMFVGMGAKRVRELFAAAKAKAPCIVFIDEIDAVGGTRSRGQEGHHRQTLNALLVEMDGFETNKGIIVMGATNLPSALDPALKRPGRFDRELVLSLPDVAGRKDILDHYLGSITQISADVDSMVLARATPGASGAMLKSIINTAAIMAVQRGMDVLDMATLEMAKDKVLMGAPRNSAVIPEAVRRKTAYHEGGHAICALYSDGAMPIYKATIMPRGNALGMVMQLPEGDQVSVTKKEMLARLDVCMGGRVAEEVMYGMENVSSGASNDFEQATDLAQRMVMRYGLGKSLGVMAVEDLKDLSPETRREVDAEVRSILDASYARAKKLISTNKNKLERLADGLMEYETITLDEIRMVVEGIPLDRDPSQSVEKPVAPPGAIVTVSAAQKP